jgi:hypothetical protein
VNDERTFPPRKYQSAAWLDVKALALLVPEAKLRRALPASAGLELETLVECPRGQRPLLIELWQVRDGRVEALGIDAHGWARLSGAGAGTLMGGAIGGVVGLGIGTVAGAAAGALAGASRGGVFGLPLGAGCGAAGGISSGLPRAMAAGADLGAALGAEFASRLSVSASRRWGTYNEILVTVPGVRTRSGLSGSFVWGMFTDSRVSRWGDRVLGFGFSKRLAAVAEDRTRYEARSLAGDVLLDAALTPTERPSSFRAQPAMASLRGSLSAPLVTSRKGRLAVAALDRAFDESRGGGLDGVVRVNWPLVPASLSGEHPVTPVGAGRPWGAFQAQRLPVRLTYPVSL